jgi:hypothetical protein
MTISSGVKGHHTTADTSGERATSDAFSGRDIPYMEAGKTISFEKKPYPIYPPFYHRMWFILLSLFFFAPLGILLMIKYARWNPTSKLIVGVISAFLFLVIVIPGNNGTPDSKSALSVTDATTSQSSSASSSSISVSTDALQNQGVAFTTTEFANMAAITTVPTVATTVSIETIAALTTTNDVSKTISKSTASTTKASISTISSTVTTTPSGENDAIVYWAPTSGEKIHKNRNCRSLKKAVEVQSGTYEEAKAAGMTGWCGICAK